MVMKKVFGRVVGVVMMICSCFGSEILQQIEKDSSPSVSTKESTHIRQEDLTKEQILDMAAQLPMLEKRYSKKFEKDVIWYDDNGIWVKSAEELQQKKENAEKILKSIGNTSEDREILLSVMEAYNDIHYELDGAYLGLECAPYIDPKGFTLSMTNIMIKVILAKIRSIPNDNSFVE